MTLTSKGLVEHVKMAQREKWGYVWGAIGRVLDKGVFDALYRQYPREVGRYYSHITQNWMNRRCADCVGLIKSYLWWNGGNIRYNPAQDVSADGMFHAARKKGHISTIPEIPGLAVWKPGHIGVYIGGGKVIEARGTIKGVILSDLKDVAWTNWLEVPFISYEAAEAVGLPKIKVNVKGKVSNIDGINRNGKTFILIDGKEVPLRKTLETLGFKVTWHQGTGTVIIQ